MCCCSPPDLSGQKGQPSRKLEPGGQRTSQRVTQRRRGWPGKAIFWKLHDTGLAQMWKASRRRWDASGALWEKGGTHGCPCVAVSGHQGVWASVGEWGVCIDHWRDMEDMEHNEHKTYYVEGGSGRQLDEQEACVRE